MVDPELVKISRERIPDEWRKKFEKRTPEELAGDVILLFDENYLLRQKLNRLYDENFILRKTNDRIQGELLTTKKELDEKIVKLSFAKWQRWTLWILVCGEGAVIGWLVKEIFLLLSRR